MKVDVEIGYAILDVKKGRKALAKHFSTRPPLGECPSDLRIPITVTGYIDSQLGNDDGTSIEFAMIVESVS
jgi:hypothetical protein